VKVVDVAPAGTVAGLWTVAALLSEAKVTEAPFGPALPVRVTVPVELLPPTTVVGLSVTVETPAAVTVSVAVTEFAVSEAVMTELEFDATGSDVTVAVAVVAPAATVTEDCTVATVVVPDARLTTWPPVGAAPVSVTVAVEVAPPKTELGASEIADTFGALTVNVAVEDVPLTVAVMTEVPCAVCVRLVTVKVPVLEPAAIVVVPGTVATLGVPDCRVTVRPPAGAGSLIMIVPVDVAPPTTVLGLRTRPVAPAGVITSDAVCVPPFAEAVIVAEVLEVTPVVVTVKVPVVAPAATVVVAGTVAAPALDPRLTVKPPVGAAEPIVTVPAEVAPPTTVVGLSERPVTCGAVTVKVAVFEAPLAVAVIVTVVLDATATVVTLNVPVVWPAATVTEAGTVAPVVALSATGKPPVPAAVARVTVPDAPTPPTTVVGVTDTLATAGVVTVSDAVAVWVPKLVVVAVIVSVSFAETATVVALNVAVEAPAATVTEAGTVVVALLDLSVTVTDPPVATGSTRVTVPAEEDPPATDVGLKLTAVTNGGHTV